MRVPNQGQEKEAMHAAGLSLKGLELEQTEFSPSLEKGIPEWFPKYRERKLQPVIPVFIAGNGALGPRSKQIPTSRAARSRVSPSSL